jgi:hypothetical protein
LLSLLQLIYGSINSDNQEKETTMSRYMYDATSNNASALVAQDPDMVAIYLTGTPDIRWLSPQVLLFPKVKTWVRIDQGGLTSPQYEATVADVEAGAWSLLDAEKRFLSKCTAPRPTLYVDRTTYKSVVSNCDLWIAAPGLSDTEATALAATDKRIVAVQNLWTVDYDRSIVLDPYWPEKPPVIVAPTDLKASAYAVVAAVAISWVSSRPAPFQLQYERLEGAQGAQEWVLIDTVTIAGTSTTITNLSHNTDYRYRINNGAWSSWLEFKTP